MTTQPKIEGTGPLKAVKKLDAIDGDVMAPDYLKSRKRLRTHSITACRQSMSRVVNAAAAGELNPEAALGLIWMISQVILALRQERDDMQIREAIERVDAAVQKLERAGSVADIVDLDQIRGATHGD